MHALHQLINRESGHRSFKQRLVASSNSTQRLHTIVHICIDQGTVISHQPTPPSLLKTTIRLPKRPAMHKGSPTYSTCHQHITVHACTHLDSIVRAFTLLRTASLFQRSRALRPPWSRPRAHLQVLLRHAVPPALVDDVHAREHDLHGHDDSDEHAHLGR